jgi:hypothetical protein
MGMSVPAYTQTPEKLATILIRNATLERPDTLLFDLMIDRNSTKWQRFANATFSLTFADTNFVISPDKIDIQFISGSSDFNVIPIAGNVPSKDYYNMLARVYPGRFSIIISGPYEYAEANAVPMNSIRQLGSFIISSKDGSMIPKDMTWKLPFFYYQACAFKLEGDSIIPPGIIWAYGNDNIEMNDQPPYTTDFQVMPPTKPKFVNDYFIAKYLGRSEFNTGALTVGLYWKTLEEAYNTGFIILRGQMPFGSKDTAAVVFKDTVATYWKNPELLGLGTRKPGKEYSFIYDSLKYRGDSYCYLLQYKNFLNDSIYNVDTACITMPHSVIVEAMASPNPFQENTMLKFTLDDDVLLSVTVYDITGKKMKSLMDKKMMQRGVGEVEFRAPDFASQGLYDVVFIAYPIDDPSVEISSSVVKVQLIR